MGLTAKRNDLESVRHAHAHTEDCDARCIRACLLQVQAVCEHDAVTQPQRRLLEGVLQPGVANGRRGHGQLAEELVQAARLAASAASNAGPTHNEQGAHGETHRTDESALEKLAVLQELTEFAAIALRGAQGDWHQTGACSWHAVQTHNAPSDRSRPSASA